MNKQQLASKIWQSANKMRSKIEANEYKDYILGFIFYKFLSDMEVKYCKDKLDITKEQLPELLTEDNRQLVSMLKGRLGFFISYDNLFSTWQKTGVTMDKVSTALSAFNRNIKNQKVFGGIFNTLYSGLSKLGDSTGKQNKSLKELLALIDDIPTDQQDYDVLGFIYEYLIANFAAGAGKKAGEFYTPHEVSVLISQVVANHLANIQTQDEITVYDPTSGSGGLLINMGKAIKGKKIRYYAQELKENTYNLTRMNLVMRGIDANRIFVRNGDTLEDDWPYFDDETLYSPMYADAVVCNPPYSQEWNPEGKENDVRFKKGLAPKSKADMAFLLHDLYHLKNDGLMAIILPHGVLFRGGSEAAIREKLLTSGHIETIVGLPEKCFYGTGIPTVILFLRKKREGNDVLFIDASKGYGKEGKNNKLRARDIKKIVDTIKDRKEIDHYSHLASLDEIKANNYNLNISRYVDSSTPPEKHDLYAMMFGGVPEKELEEFEEYWKEFPVLKTELFGGKEYKQLKVQDIEQSVKDSSEVQDFINKYNTALSGFDESLKKKLFGLIDWNDCKTELAGQSGEGFPSIEASRGNSDHSPIQNAALVPSLEDVPSSVSQAGGETEIDAIWNAIGDEMFARLSPVPLIDKYEAWQILDSGWQTIAADLEVLQTEGLSAARVIEPNIVIENGKEKEKGKIFPFELIGDTFFSSEKDRTSGLEESLSSVNEQLSELAPEEDYSFLSSKGEFVKGKVKAALKDNSWDDETKELLKKASHLLDQKTELERQVKAEKAKLQQAIESKLTALSPEEIRYLLFQKWIAPLLSELQKVPASQLDGFIQGLEKLARKYDQTLEDLDREIKESEMELAGMLRKLTGNEFDMAGVNKMIELLESGV